MISTPRVRGSSCAAVFAVVLAIAAPARGEIGRVAQQIVNGTLTDGDSGVVGLTLGPSRFLFCTATLISPRIVITSAHCVSYYRADEIEVFVGSLPGEGTYHPVAHILTHPQYNRYTDANDIAALLVATPLDASTWPPLPPTADRDLLRNAVRIVGYGLTNIGAPRRAVHKREGDAVIGVVEESRLVLDGNPATICYGDSGGPAFVTIDDVEYLAGIALRGDCLLHAYHTRVDIHVEDFIQPYEELVTPGRAVVGERCLFPGHCEAGLECLPDGDGTGPEICTRACGASSECPAGMECLPDAAGALRCAWPIPQPGALEGICTFHSDCVQGYCDTGTLLARGKCRFPSPEGCAGAGGSTPGSGWPGLMLLSIFLLGMRRRARRARNRSSSTA